MAVRAVLIDLGGTLWTEHVDLEAIETTAAGRLALALPGIDLDEARLLAQLLADECEAHKADTVQDLRPIVSAAARRAGLKAMPNVDLVRAAMGVPPDPHWLLPGADELLGAISGAGLRCVLVSNTWWYRGDDLAEALDQMGVGAQFDGFISSLDVERRKPDPAIFGAALAVAGSTMAETVMVGNSETNDILGARRLGIRTVRVAIEEDLPTMSAADYVTGSLTELAGLFFSGALSQLGLGRRRT